MLAELRDTEQDYEWYPTTNEIIESVRKHSENLCIGSLLDIGAGNGKVLKALHVMKTEGGNMREIDLFAIEKSRPLLESLPIEVGILGTDFWEQSLLDKRIDCIFSNPPYSEFVDWTAKLVREANSDFVYLVLPQRWNTQDKIMHALKARKAKCEIVGSFDFFHAEDRKANAKVDLIFIQLCHDSRIKYPYRHGRETLEVDPFELWVKDFFAVDDQMNKKTPEQFEKRESDSQSRKSRIENALVKGDGLIETLHELYMAELNMLISNYQKVCSLDPALFKELDISLASVIGSIKTRISGLKDAYWTELFNNYEPLTKRLTKKSREVFIKSIRAKTNIDFTPSNAYAITVWAIKNASQYFEKQMVDTFDQLTELANVINYKSNAKVYSQNQWRYMEVKPTHFKLDYRIVLERVGGICSSSYTFDGRSGLSHNAADFLDDLITVAHNLGFEYLDSVSNHSFVPGQKELMLAKNKAGQEITLMEVKAYKNRNMHIRFDQNFMLAMNVEIGRLKGWIHNVQEAANELGESVDTVHKYFKSTYQVIPSDLSRLLLGVAK
jgi:hypothetical protein